MRTMIGWISFTKFALHSDCTVCGCVRQTDCLTGDNVYATAFLICREKTEKRFFDLCMSSWFVEKPWSLSFDHSVKSSWALSRCCSSRDVIMDSSGLMGRRLRADHGSFDHHVSFRPLLSLSGSWISQFSSSSEPLRIWWFSFQVLNVFIISPALRLTQKKFMSSIKALIEHPSF